MTDKFDIYKLLDKSYNLFKNNLSDFIQISAAQSLLSLLQTIIFRNKSDTLNLVDILFILILIFIQLRLTMTLVIIIMDRYQDRESSIFDCYKKSGEKFWLYIGSSFMVGIIAGLPLVLFFLALSFSGTFIVKLIVILIGGIVVIYLFMHYFLAPMIVVLNPDSQAALSESFELVKKDRFSVVYVLITTAFFQWFPYLIFNVIGIKGLFGSIIEVIPHIFIAPFNLCIVLIFYDYLISRENPPELAH